MVFGFLKKKKSIHSQEVESLLALDRHSFTRFVRDLLVESEPASATMCIVALQNLGPILQAFLKIGQRKPNSGWPEDLDAFIRLLTKDNPPEEERASRRHYWLLWASLVRRATTFAEHDVSLQQDTAVIWVRLIEGGKYLKVLLRENIVWDTSEKEWFTHIKSEKQGAQYVLNYMLPKWLFRHAEIDAIAETLDLHLVTDYYL